MQNAFTKNLYAKSLNAKRVNYFSSHPLCVISYSLVNLLHFCDFTNFAKISVYIWSKMYYTIVWTKNKKTKVQVYIYYLVYTT